VCPARGFISCGDLSNALRLFGPAWIQCALRSILPSCQHVPTMPSWVRHVRLAPIAEKFEWS
jgi:hypothetical protein